MLYLTSTWDEPMRIYTRYALPTLEAAYNLGFIDAVDGFCERIAFSTEQMERLFKVARKLGLPIKLHAEQLSHFGGTQLATRYDAISADHLEYAVEEDAMAMARAGTVAVMLPGAFYTLREKQLPPIEAFRSTESRWQWQPIATRDLRPLCSLLMAMNMACTLFRLTPEESLKGTTKHAAHALRLEDAGSIERGMRADLAIWDVSHPAELAYRIGFNPLWKRIYCGRLDSQSLNDG